jgi:predicted transport protein
MDMDDAVKNQIANLEKMTGKNFDEWIMIAKSSGFAKHGEIVKFLKTEHGMGHGYANLVTHKALQSDAGSHGADDLLEAQYAGPKAALRSIYDKLAAEIAGFGSDIEFAPKKAYMSLRRKKQFACLQPSTAARFDVGINLKGIGFAGRLEKSGSWNAMVSHRVRVQDIKQVDKELIGWLRQAYDQAG